MNTSIKWLLVLFFLGYLSGNAQNREYAQEMIQTLSSPGFQGRGYVNSGDSVAAEFIRQQFEKIGLGPVNGSYFQSFRHSVNTFPGEVSLQIDGTRLVAGADFLVDPSSASGKGSANILLLTAEEIIAGQWVANVKKSKNKLLLIDLRDQPGENSALREFSEYLRKEENIPAKAIGFLQKGKIPWYVSSTQALRPSFYIFADSLDSSSMTKIAYEVDAELIENYPSRNVIGFLKGTSRSDSSVVISAHYDHLGRMGQSTFFPGAHDNASGVALLLDLAQKMREEPPYYDTYFIAFAGEEAGLVGSRYFVEHPVFPLQDIKFLLNLDLAGTGEEGITVVNGSVYTSYFDALKSINQRLDLMKEVKARGEACNSDHCFFYRQGVPSFFVYTLGGTHYYHDIYDKAETLSLSEYEDYFTLIYHFLKEMPYLEAD